MRNSQNHRLARSVGSWLYGRRWILRTRAFQIFAVLLFITIFIHSSWTKHVAAEAAADRAAQQAALVVAHRKSTEFGQQVAAIMAAHPGITTSVSIATSELDAQNFGSDEVFDAASTGKILTAISYLSLVERGKASLSERIDGQTAAQLLNVMIIKSDDSAWATLNEYITHAGLERQAIGLGITDYDPATNSLSSKDIALLLHDLADGSILNAQHRQLLMSLLARANYRDFIVPAVKSPNLVYHKIGIDNDNVHDAAIIKHGSTWLVLVIYTNGNGQYNWTGRAAMMQQITAAAQAAYL